MKRVSTNAAMLNLYRACTVAFLIMLIMSFIPKSKSPEPMATPQSNFNEFGNKEYQIEVTQSGTALYDGNRLVGVVPYSKHNKLDQLIDSDNE